MVCHSIGPTPFRGTLSLFKLVSSSPSPSARSSLLPSRLSPSPSSERVKSTDLVGFSPAGVITCASPVDTSRRTFGSCAGAGGLSLVYGRGWLGGTWSSELDGSSPGPEELAMGSDAMILSMYAFACFSTASAARIFSYSR